MKARAVLVFLLIFGFFACGPMGAGVLEGCTDPKAYSAAFAKIHDEGWPNISLPRLRSMWPTELGCNSEDCSSVWSKDRIIAGHCECCASFSFSNRIGENSSNGAGLHNLVINYSNDRRDDLVAMAKVFASALGMNDKDSSTIGHDQTHTYTWEDRRHNIEELFGIEVRFTRVGRHWELYFNASRYLK